MDCPRCGGPLSTFAVETTDRSAVVCEACGFAGVAASHRGEERNPESWERAVERFETADVSLEQSRQTGRADAVSVPTDDSDSRIDAAALEESVTVASALREREAERDRESERSQDATETEGSSDA
ncbi:MAG: hypothetical protein J07HX5_00161 [halophilic archaeon J07HX5]|jgi:hypothetical protein|nr:MAG: hypothetical protein J07HX5_00161 [halophilic archaeon J07HX5]